MKKRQSVKEMSAIAASELNEINELNQQQRQEARQALKEKMDAVDPHLYSHVEEFVTKYAALILKKEGASGSAMANPALLIDDRIKKDKDKLAQAQARALVSQGIYLMARDVFEKENIITQDPNTSTRPAQTNACGEEVLEAFNMIQAKLQPIRNEKAKERIEQQQKNVDQALASAERVKNTNRISELQNTKKELRSSLIKIQRLTLDPSQFLLEQNSLSENINQHIQKHNRPPKQTAVEISEAKVTETSPNTSVESVTPEPTLKNAEVSSEPSELVIDTTERLADLKENKTILIRMMGEEGYNALVEETEKARLDELLSDLEAGLHADTSIALAEEALKDIERPAKSGAERESAQANEDKKATTLEELLNEPEVTEEEKSYLKESIQIDRLNNELDDKTNNFLRYFYENKENSNADFFTQLENNYPKLADRIDPKKFGFTHQEMKETFDRLKAFVAELERINDIPMHPLAKAEVIAQFIRKNPSFYQDAANVMGYTSGLMSHFKNESNAFSTSMKNTLDAFTSKFNQWVPKYTLMMREYLKSTDHHETEHENATQLIQVYSDISNEMNNSSATAKTPLLDKFRKLSKLETKDGEVKTKTVASKTINEEFNKVRDQLGLLIAGQISAEDKSKLVGQIEGVLSLYAQKLPGGTSVDNKKIILRNIPLLMEFCQLVDPKHVNKDLADKLSNAIIGLRDPQAKNPLDFQEEDPKRLEQKRKDFFGLTTEVLLAIEETTNKGKKEALKDELKEIAASFEEIDFKEGLPNTEDKGKEDAHQAAAAPPKVEIEFADLSAQFQELSELKEPVQAESAKPEAPEAPSEPEISMIDVEENKAMQSEITAAKEAAPVVQVAPPMAPVEPEPSAVQKTASVARKAPTKEIPPEIAEFKKNLGTEGSVMYHLRFGYRTAKANMKPAEYIEHLKVCEPELYKLSEARAQRQIQGKQTDTPQSNRAEYREAMRNFRSEGKFGPIIALVGTGLGAVSNDLKTFATRITNPGLYRQQRDEAQLRAQIMAVSSELVKRVSQPETIPGTWQLRVELTRPLHQSIQADLNKVGKPGTDMNALRQKYSGSTTEVLKELLEKSNDQQAAKRELQAKNKQLNTVLEREDLSPKSREIFEAKQKKIEANIQKIDGAHQQESKATNIVMIVQIDTQLKSVMQQLHQAGIEPVTTKWPISRLKEHEQRTPLATLSFSCKEQKIEDLAAKLAQIRHPVSTERIKGNPVFKDNYSQALEKVQASRDQGQSTNTAKITINK